MIAYLKFNLDDPDDREEYRLCLQAKDVLLALWEFRYDFMKHRLNSGFPEAVETKEDAVDYIISNFYRIIEDHNVDLNIS